MPSNIWCWPPPCLKPIENRIEACTCITYPTKVFKTSRRPFRRKSIKFRNIETLLSLLSTTNRIYIERSHNCYRNTVEILSKSIWPSVDIPPTENLTYISLVLHLNFTSFHPVMTITVMVMPTMTITVTVMVDMAATMAVMVTVWLFCFLLSVQFS